MKASSLPRIFLLSPLWYLLKVLEGSHLLFVLPCWDPHLWLHYKTRCHLLLYVYWFDLVSRALEMVQPTEISTCNMWQHTVTDKLIKMVNFFKLGNEMWRWINQHDTSVGKWVRFLSGTQNFSLSHARVMFINSPSHFITELKFHHLY